MKYQAQPLHQAYWTQWRITVVTILVAISVLLFATTPAYAEGDTETESPDVLEQVTAIEGMPSTGPKLSELESYTVVMTSTMKSSRNSSNRSATSSGTRSN